MSSPEPQALAELVRRAEEGRYPIPQLSESTPAFDPAVAYEVQRLNFEHRLRVRGESMLGYKLGLTSRAKQVAMGVAEPLWGRLASGHLHPEDQPLRTDQFIHPRVEPEIAFLIGRDIAGATATTASVLAATEAVFPALEILDSRYEDFRFTHPDVIADNASAAALVCGGRSVAPTDLDTQVEGMVLRRDGEVVATAAGAAVSGHPAAAVAWLAREVGRLPAGAIVLSGGLTAPVSLAPGMTVSAEFTHLGTVTICCA